MHETWVEFIGFIAAMYTSVSPHFPHAHCYKQLLLYENKINERASNRTHNHVGVVFTVLVGASVSGHSIAALVASLVPRPRGLGTRLHG